MAPAFVEGPNLDLTARSLDNRRVSAEAEQLLRGAGKSAISWDGPSVFANVPLYVSREQLAAMARVVEAIDTLAKSPAYQAQVFANAPEIARIAKASHGVFYGYDFHLTETGPRLIEVNTNAGGAMLSLLMSRAQEPTTVMQGAKVALASEIAELESHFIQMFLTDWSLARGDAPMRTIAIVDDVPEQQFLYREFLLFQAILERASYRTLIVSPEELTYEGGQLRAGEQPIDLVYNRLVDFYLEEPRHRALREAYLDDAVVITPHPRAHALFADKRNLVRFSDLQLLTQAGLSEDHRAALLDYVPETRVVRQEDAEELWRDRKSWFFKPIQGYGSKAAYQGAKLTKSTFAEILTREYVAQRQVAPGERLVASPDGEASLMKFDVRGYAYDSKVLLWAARLYHGQTTNFRTVGGGFAPVFTTP